MESSNAFKNHHAFREAVGSRVVGGCEAVINVGQFGDRAEDLVAEFRSIVALTDLWKANVAKFSNKVRATVVMDLSGSKTNRVQTSTKMRRYLFPAFDLENSLRSKTTWSNGSSVLMEVIG